MERGPWQTTPRIDTASWYRRDDIQATHDREEPTQTPDPDPPAPNPRTPYQTPDCRPQTPDPRPQTPDPMPQAPDPIPQTTCTGPHTSDHIPHTTNVDSCRTQQHSINKVSAAHSSTSPTRPGTDPVDMQPRYPNDQRSMPDWAANPWLGVCVYGSVLGLVVSGRGGRWGRDEGDLYLGDREIQAPSQFWLDLNLKHAQRFNSDF